MTTIIIIAIVVLLIFILFKWSFKIPKCGNMVLITGGIKTGKTMLSVRMVYKKWKQQVFKAKAFNFFKKYFSWLVPKLKKQEKKEMPLVYSNVPLGIPYVPLTTDLIMRKDRFVYGSVIYMCESSLVADSMTFKSDFVNENVNLFAKLIAHSTKGGYLILDTQR